MAKAVQKVALNASRDIPFNKLELSQSNVRRIKAGVAIEELAEDIARRGLLQSLTVRAVVDAEGRETGQYEIPAGGRRYRALELLVKQKRLAKTAPIPCVLRDGGIAEEDLLAENVQRAPLHPLDQFRAFVALRERGQSEEEIAATFFVTPAVVRQRLKLAAVSARLLEAYAEDALSLDQVMAFTVSPDHERQEQVLDRARHAHALEPYAIRRMLTEGAARASDKRARFIGLDVYVAAGGPVMTDLFQADDGGWLQDVALVDRLVAEKLEREASAVRAEGWKWVEVSADLPYGHAYGLRRLRGEPLPLTTDEEATKAALQAEYDRIDKEHPDADDLPEAVAVRLAEIDAALAAFEDRPVRFNPADVARAGAFVSIDGMGTLRIERGYVRKEDEPPVVAEPQAEAAALRAVAASLGTEVANLTSAPRPAGDEDDMTLRPLPDRLHTELTAWRTLGLRRAVGERFNVALMAALHALCLRLFYRYAEDSCLDLDVRSVALLAQGGYGLGDSALAAAVDQRHARIAADLPQKPQDLWDALAALDAKTREGHFAHCVSLSVNAGYEAYNRRPRALAHADRLAEAVDLDMSAEGWSPTVETYLARVPKARIVAAVREARGDDAARRMEDMTKADMSETAEELLAGTGWLPEPLRTPGRASSDFASEDIEDAAPQADARPALNLGVPFGDAPSVKAALAQGAIETDAGKSPSLAAAE